MNIVNIFFIEYEVELILPDLTILREAPDDYHETLKAWLWKRWVQPKISGSTVKYICM